MRKSLIALAALAAVFVAGAADVQGRIVIIGTRGGVSMDPGKAEGGSVTNSTWDNDPVKAKQVVVAMFPSGIEWKKGRFSFTPDKDGSVSLILKGAWCKDDSAGTWTIIDGTRAEGAEIKNGNFEDGAENWSLGGPDGDKASISDIAKSGSKSIKVSHNSFASQNIDVKAGHPVVISFWHKSGE